MYNSLYQLLVTQCAFPVIDAVVGTQLHRMYVSARRYEYRSREEIGHHQDILLRKLLVHAYKTVPYYSDLFDRINLRGLDTASADILERIPPLTKDIIRSNYDKLISTDSAKRRSKVHSTGGSTGNPMKFVLDLDSWSYTWANIFRGWGYAGYRIGDKVLMLGSSSIFRDYKKSIEQKFLHTLFNFTAFPGMNMSDETCVVLTDCIRNENVKFLYGYSSALYLFAKYVIKNNIRLNVQGVFPTSEMCPDHYKREYTKAFNCAVVDCYGARDGGISAFQCQYGSFHISENCIARTETGEGIGEVFITDLYNYCMPFINYSVGDFLELTDAPCSCGRGAPCSRSIVGRKEEIMQFKNGRNITGPGWTILFKDRSVEKYRLIRRDEDHLEVQIVPSTGYRKETEEEIIVSSIQKHIGEDIHITIVYSDDFQPLANGKAGYFIG